MVMMELGAADLSCFCCVCLIAVVVPSSLPLLLWRLWRNMSRIGTPADSSAADNSAADLSSTNRVGGDVLKVFTYDGTRNLFMVGRHFLLFFYVSAVLRLETSTLRQQAGGSALRNRSPLSRCCATIVVLPLPCAFW